MKNIKENNALFDFRTTLSNFKREIQKVLKFAKEQIIKQIVIPLVN
jgi:hypothetical protein